MAEPEALRVVVVTDPMCSWCWGMSPAVEEAAYRLRDEVTFDFLLGGINTHATQPVGDYGRRLLMKIWREVAETTNQAFGFRLPEVFVYNSTAPCVAVAALRRAVGRPPFGYLHRLQQLLFVEGHDITKPAVLASAAQEFGHAPAQLLRDLADPSLTAEVRAEFESSRHYGTNALPTVLIERAGERRLLAGGYADADMLEKLIRAQLAS